MSLPAEPVAQTPDERFREYLDSRPTAQRYTPQQQELVAHIFARHKHFDPDELLADLKAAGRTVSRATVYRTLAKLVEAGLLRTIAVGPRTVYDHDYGYPAHDHLSCDGCGALIEFQLPAVAAAVREAAAGHRFRADRHTLVVRGTCEACNARRAAARRLVL